ncbi:MAG: AEC family transporter [Sphingomonadaceae bacterium]|nr:AEC family transporter [Sphingomonadaceae bacterium]
MTAMFGTVLPIFALIACGFGFARWRRLGADAVALLNSFTVWLALPALLFRAVASAPVVQLWQPSFLIAFSAGMAATFVVALLLPHGRGSDLASRTIDGLCAAYANTAFIGIPLMAGLFGAANIGPAIVATLLTVCLLFAIACLLIELDVHRDHPARVAARRVAIALVRNPLVLSPLAGGLWNACRLPLPAALDSFTTLLGGAATPVALVTIGMFLAQPSRAGRTPGLAPLLLLKLVAQPLLTWLALLALPAMPPLWAKGAILIAALPTGTGPFMVAQLYDRELAVSSRVILISTIISVITVSALAWHMTG